MPKEKTTHGIGRTCACGHALGWHESLDGECSIGGCDCKAFLAENLGGEAPASEKAIPLTQPPPKSAGN